MITLCPHIRYDCNTLAVFELTYRFVAANEGFVVLRSKRKQLSDAANVALRVSKCEVKELESILPEI